MNVNLSGDFETREVYLNGKFLSPAASLKKRNHSPDGFNWGYGGSGPAQLALAITLALYGDNSPIGYQDLKFKVIAALPQSDFDVTIELPDLGEVVDEENPKWGIIKNIK